MTLAHGGSSARISSPSAELTRCRSSPKSGPLTGSLRCGALPGSQYREPLPGPLHPIRFLSEDGSVSACHGPKGSACTGMFPNLLLSYLSDYVVGYHMVTSPSPLPPPKQALPNPKGIPKDNGSLVGQCSFCVRVVMNAEEDLAHSTLPSITVCWFGL